MFAICVGFCSCPYNVFKCFRSSHVCHVCLLFLFLPVQSLFTCFRSSYSFCRLCLSLSSLITLPQTVRLFYVSLRSQAPQQQYTGFPFLQCKGMATVTNWPLHVHYHIRLSVGIPFWSSRKRQSQTSKFDGKTTIPRAPSHVITHYRYVCVTEYGNIACKENGWLSHGTWVF